MDSYSMNLYSYGLFPTKYYFLYSSMLSPMSVVSFYRLEVSHCMNLWKYVNLLANKYLGCFQFLTLMNKPSMNITVQVFLMDKYFYISLITVKMLGGITGIRLHL